MLQKSWFFIGVLSALGVGAFANFPSTGSTTGSMAITPEVSEIKAKRHEELSFDQDMKQLASIQGRYRENLPVAKRAALHSRAGQPKKVSAKARSRTRGKRL